MEISNFFLLRKTEEIQDIVKEFLEKKSVTKEKMELLDRKVLVLKTAIKTNLFSK